MKTEQIHTFPKSLKPDQECTAQLRKKDKIQSVLHVRVQVEI